MRVNNFLAVSVLLVACGSKPSTLPPQPLTVPPYSPLLSRARAHDTALNFTDLRLGYTGSPEYAPYDTRDSDLRKAMYAAADSEAFAAALGWADSILTFNFVDIEAHGLASYASAQLGDSNRAEHHRWVTTGLLTSIDNSGDGSQARPYVVISVSEEYAWATYRGFRRKGIQSLGECNQHPCDSVEFTDRRTQRDTTLYFDVSIPYNTMTRLFKE